MTCGEVARLAFNFAKSLLKEGVQQGDVVGIVGKNSNFVSPVIFGCFLIAAPISPIDSKWDDFTITYEITEPKIIFCDNDVVENVMDYVKSKEKNTEVVILTEKVDGYRHVSEYFEENNDVQM